MNPHNLPPLPPIGQAPAPGATHNNPGLVAVADQCYPPVLTEADQTQRPATLASAALANSDGEEQRPAHLDTVGSKGISVSTSSAPLVNSNGEQQRPAHLDAIGSNGVSVSPSSATLVNSNGEQQRPSHLDTVGSNGVSVGTSSAPLVSHSGDSSQHLDKRYAAPSTHQSPKTNLNDHAIPDLPIITPTTPPTDPNENPNFHRTNGLPQNVMIR